MTLQEFTDLWQRTPDGFSVLKKSAGGTGVPDGGTKMLLSGGNIDSNSLSAGLYYAPNKTYSLSGSITALASRLNVATAPVSCTLAPFQGYLSNLYVQGNASTSGVGETFTVYVNGTATPVTCTVAAAASAASDSTDSYFVSAGDRISLNYVSGSSGIFTSATWSMTLSH